ncbi:hypothetical protein PSI22_19715 [Xenorhabdus sp. XENO-7]|uniref:Uncharacterized protein n=1 Tax=Xenorhabdus aichiensis TaxID=3025874 RepID=A0ABT5M7Y9_9GAMM|nr:hypothetical protein [Xenorhabdus aichiensis]MDC9623799.1 hypothetical protein [Xenorhabdus aichiensis]
MNIIQKIKMMFPLKKMYVPSGWVIAKNNLIDADVNIFDKLNNDEQFLIKENFFSSNVFYSFSECFTDKNIYIKGVIDVGCLCYNINSNLEQGNLLNCEKIHYQITLSLYKGKSKVSFYSQNKIVNERYEMINEVNFLMQFFSEKVVDVINHDGFKTDLGYYSNMSRESLNLLTNEKNNFSFKLE